MRSPYTPYAPPQTPQDQQEELVGLQGMGKDKNMICTADDINQSFLYSSEHTNNYDVADSFPGSGTVFHNHSIPATVLTLSFHQAQ